MAGFVNEIEIWRQTNNSFLNKFQHQLLQQQRIISDQHNMLKMQETAQARLNAQYTCLLDEHRHLKTKLEETQMVLSYAQKEKEKIKSYAELPRKFKQQKAVHQCDIKSTKLDKADKVLQTVISDMKSSATSRISNAGDGHTVVEPTVNTVTSPADGLFSKSVKRWSITIGGLRQNIKHNDLMQYFSKFGTVRTVIMAESNKSKRKGMVVFVGSSPTVSTTATIDGVVYSLGRNIDHFLNGKKKVEVVEYPTPMITQPSKAMNDSLHTKAVDTYAHGNDLMAQFSTVSFDEFFYANFVFQVNDTFTCQPCQSEHSVQWRVVFNPCGHGTCGDCAAQFENCHVCKHVIGNIVKQFE